MLGAFQLLRRIDTDFVNLAPIVAFSGAAHPTYTIAHATVVTKGSPEVSGTWVPLAGAQSYVREHLSSEKAQILAVFLSEKLVERFPTALQDFHKSTMARSLNQFGKHFASTLQASHWETEVTRPRKFMTQQYSAHAPITPFLLGLSLAGDKHVEDQQAPLSATEQQLFHELCIIPDEQIEQPEIPAISLSAGGADDLSKQGFEPVSPLSPVPLSPQVAIATLPMKPLILSSETASSEEPEVVSTTSTTPLLGPENSRRHHRFSERPLRRSRRVADALAAAHSNPSRTRSRKNGSRNSLS